MPVPKGHVLVAAYMPTEMAARFKALANGRGVSAKLRQLVGEATAQPVTWPGPRQAAARQVQVRLSEDQATELLRVAHEAGMTPSGYLGAIARAHLTGKPQWSPAERGAMREIAEQVRRVGNNVNQIAMRLNAAATAAEYPRGQGSAAKEAVAEIRDELARLADLASGNLERWRA